MSCPEFEPAILEGLDGTLSADGRHALADHIATCPACRRFAAAQRALDQRLTAALPTPRLSRDFFAHLRQRIARETGAFAHEPLARERSALEIEYRAAVTAWSKNYFRSSLSRWPDLLNWIGIVCLAVVGLSYATGRAAGWLAAAPDNLSPVLVWGVTATCLILAAATIWKRPTFLPTQWFE